MENPDNNVEEYKERTSKSQKIIIILVGGFILSVIAPGLVSRAFFTFISLAIISSPAWIIYWIFKFIFNKVKLIKNKGKIL